jgi:hypothetical protein
LQREREQEIYEVLPPAIEVPNACSRIGERPSKAAKLPVTKEIRRLVRKASFHY